MTSIFLSIYLFLTNCRNTLYILDTNFCWSYVLAEYAQLILCFHSVFFCEVSFNVLDFSLLVFHDLQALWLS